MNQENEHQQLPAGNLPAQFINCTSVFVEPETVRVSLGEQLNRDEQNPDFKWVFVFAMPRMDAVKMATMLLEQHEKLLAAQTVAKQATH